MPGPHKSILLTVVFVLLSSTFWIATGNVGKPEKIFRHERLDQQKLARVDLDNEDLQRALEDLRRRVPEYTGYLLVDIVFEIAKMFFILILRVTGHQQNPTASE